MEIRKYYIETAKYINSRNFELLQSNFQKIIENHGNQGVEKHIHVPKYNPGSFIWIDKLENVFNSGDQFLKNIIAHGSFGDYTNIPYSDLDITLLLREEVFTDKEIFTEFSKWEKQELYPFLYSIDPLQHHGPFYLWDKLANNYSDKVLPADVYNHSWGLRKTKLTLNLKTDHKLTESRDLLSLRTCDALINNKIFRFGYSMYNIKRYLSNLMLIPAFYYTDSNNAMPKKDSFQRFYNEFGEAALPIKLATELRSNWNFESTVLSKITQLKLVNGVIRKLVLSPFTNKKYKEKIVKNINPLIPDLKDAIKSKLDVKDS